MLNERIHGVWHVGSDSGVDGSTASVELGGCSVRRRAVGSGSEGTFMLMLPILTSIQP
jgi:hypothetical protein